MTGIFNFGGKSLFYLLDFYHLIQLLKQLIITQDFEKLLREIILHEVYHEVYALLSALDITAICFITEISLENTQVWVPGQRCGCCLLIEQLRDVVCRRECSLKATIKILLSVSSSKDSQSSLRDETGLDFLFRSVLRLELRQL